MLPAGLEEEAGQAAGKTESGVAPGFPRTREVGGRGLCLYLKLLRLRPKAEPITVAVRVHLQAGCAQQSIHSQEAVTLKSGTLPHILLRETHLLPLPSLPTTCSIRIRTTLTSSYLWTSAQA